MLLLLKPRRLLLLLCALKFEKRSRIRSKMASARGGGRVNEAGYRAENQGADGPRGFVDRWTRCPRRQHVRGGRWALLPRARACRCCMPCSTPEDGWS